LFPIFPDPEISLEPGTDIQAELAQAVPIPADLPAVSQVPALEQNPELTRSLSRLPERTLTKKGKEADVVDIVFAGSQADLEKAFQVAGWRQSEMTSAHTVARQFYSFLTKSSYATAPMSAQQLDGRMPDHTLEKAIQSQDKRNHIRIWKLESTWEGMPLWAGAAVRETGATLSVRQKGFIHHVSEDLGEEQRTVLQDLWVADCVEAAGYLPRPAMDHFLRNATGEFFRTDGSLLVAQLKPCAADSPATTFREAPHSKPRSWVFRFLRREILTVRSDLWRANCVYATFDLTRMAVAAARQGSYHRQAEAAFTRANTILPVRRTQPPNQNAADQLNDAKIAP